MEAEFYNLYVEKLLTEVTELTKQKILLLSQIAWADKQLKENNELKNKIENANNDLVEKIKQSEQKAVTFEEELNSARTENANAYARIRELEEENIKVNEDLKKALEAKAPKKKVKISQPDEVPAES